MFHVHPYLGRKNNLTNIFFRSLLSTTSHVTISTISSKMGTEKTCFPNRNENHLPTTIFLRGKLAVKTSGGSVTLPAFTTKRAGLKNGALASATGRSNGRPRIIHIKVVDPWSCQTMACEWRFLEWFDHGSGQISWRPENTSFLGHPKM